MPYYSAWNDIGSGMNNMAGTLASALLRKKFLELQNQQFATNAALRAEQLGLQAQQVGLQERQVEDTLGEAKATRGRAETGSRALLLQDMLRNPALWQNETTLRPAIDMLRKEGVVPQDRFEIDRNSLGSALASLARSKFMETAVSTPQTATATLRPPEVSPGATLANPLNPWEALMTAPGRVGAAERGYVVPRGGMFISPEGETVKNEWTAQDLPLSPNAILGFLGKKTATFEDLTPEEAAYAELLVKQGIQELRSKSTGAGQAPQSSQELINGAYYPMSDGSVRQYLGVDAQGQPKWGNPIVSK